MSAIPSLGTVVIYMAVAGASWTVGAAIVNLVGALIKFLFIDDGEP